MTKASVDFERNRMLPVVLMYQPIPAGIELSIRNWFRADKKPPGKIRAALDCSA